MVKLTIDYIKKITYKPYSSPDRDDTSLKKITHLSLPERCIDQICDISEVKNLTVLYLHHNSLHTIQNLEKNVCLTHLYLQHNKIIKMENLNALRHLKKLYLGHNCISVVEGLDTVKSLEELHIENQKLAPGETMYFDPRTINNLASCLRILDISGNRVPSIDDLKNLGKLEKLNASNNALSNLLSVCNTVKNWPRIKELDFRSNEIVKQNKYRDKIIASSDNLKTLDAKDIADVTRSFIHRFEMVKEERNKKLLNTSLDQTPFSDEIASIAEHLPPGLRKSVSASVKKEALPRAKSLTLSLMHVPLNSSATRVEEGVVSSGGLQPRPSRRVSYAESQVISKQKADKKNQKSLPQLGDDIPISVVHSPLNTQSN